MSLLVFSKVNDDGEIDEKGFSKCLFWLQIQRIPALWMTKKVGLLLWGKADKVLVVDGGEGKLKGAKWLRVRVLFDVTKLLKQGCWLNIANGDCRCVTFKWERVPDFCFVCGCLDHHENDCKK